MDKITKIFRAISEHFLLRNIIIAFCAIVIFLYLTSLALNIFTRHGEKYEVPDLIGKTIAGAEEYIKEADLQLVVNDSLYVAGLLPGSIIDQSPEPTSFVKSGRKVFLVINATNPRSEVIPYVTGYSIRLAKNILQSQGFTIDRLIYRSDIATNNVIGQKYKGKEIKKGSNQKAVLGEGVTLTVGRASDAPLPLVPNVVGLDIREAKSRLWETGLNVGSIINDDSVNEKNINEAKVYKQTPGQHTRNDYGAKVTLYMSVDKNRVKSGKDRAEQEIRDAIENPSEEISEEEFNEIFAE